MKCKLCGELGFPACLILGFTLGVAVALIGVIVLRFMGWS